MATSKQNKQPASDAAEVEEQPKPVPASERPAARNTLPGPFANSTLASRAGKAPKPKPGSDNSTFAARAKAAGKNKRVDADDTESK
jgi:hypothetical protein